MATAGPIATSPPPNIPQPIVIQQAGGGFGGPLIKIVLISGAGIAVYYWWSNTTLGKFSGWNLWNKFLDPKQRERSQKISKEVGSKCGKETKGLGKITCIGSGLFSSGLGGLFK